MTTFILLACSILALVLAWRFRRRLAHHIPRKENMTTTILVAATVVLAVLALLPEILILVSTVNLMPLFIKTALGLAAAAAIIYVGCSKRTEAPKQPAIQWTAPETGYHAETPPEIPKEGQ